MFTVSQAWYDLIYEEGQGKDYADEVQRLRSCLATHGIDAATLGRPPRLLDVACGTGLHLSRLEDFERVGVDVDPGMLDRAAARCHGAMLVEADMRALDAKELGAPFDVVTCLFSSIAYMPDVPALCDAILGMSRCLGRGGLLVIEPFVTPQAVVARKAWMNVVDHPDLKVVRMDVPEIHGRRLDLEFNYLVADSEGVRHLLERHQVSLFTEEEIQHAIDAAGLESSFDHRGLSETGRGLHIGVKR